MTDRDHDLDAFRRFVAQSAWRFAKTYVESYPHEYTVLTWAGTDADVFAHAIRCIENQGVVESFYSAQRKYLYVDDRKYWHMGDPSSDDADKRPGLINRTWVDVGRYREDAKALGRGEEDLDQLVARWRANLERARRGA